MQIAFLDEFGHCGPYVSRQDPKYNTSPVFGLAGYVMPAREVRHFATFFYQLKQFMLKAEINAAGVHPATWEKKGAKLLTTKNIRKYAHLREGMSRFLNEIYKCNGRIIYYGREKYQAPQESNSGGLYNTVMSHSIRAIDRYCNLSNSPFLMILDRHSSRIKLLEAASKTMFGAHPARYLLEPPFEVESHLYQTVQAADWVATLIGRIEAYRTKPDEYAAWEWAERLFGNKIDTLATHSKMWRPQPGQITH